MRTSPEPSEEPRISVDLGGSSVRVAAGTLADGVLRQKALAIDIETSATRVLTFIKEAIRDFGSRDVSVGVSFPGLLSPEGRVLNAPNLNASWQGVVVAEAISESVELSESREPSESRNLRVSVANDARTATLGELVFGESLEPHLRPQATMVYLGLGTGVGGGVVVNGQLHGGRSGAAGELGHMVIDQAGPRCGCGSRGCVEAIAGGIAILAAARELLEAGEAPRLDQLLEQDEHGRLDVRKIAQAAAFGDASLQALLDRAARALGILAANLVHTLSPDVIVVGGGISQLGARLFEPLWDELGKRVRMVPLDGLRIEASALGDQAGMLGGLVLADGANSGVLGCYVGQGVERSR